MDCVQPSSSSPLIQTFPPELLSQIFGKLDFPEAVVAANTCREWHEAAIADSGLWLSISINNSDIVRPEWIQTILERSMGRPIALALCFPSLPDRKQINSTGLYQLLRSVVKKHLGQCIYLGIHADEPAWAILLDAFTGEKFPLLHCVDVRNDDLVSQWHSLFDPEANIPPPPMPPGQIVFPLPHNHSLSYAVTQGLSLGDVELPTSGRLHIAYHSSDLVVDQRLNPRLSSHVTELILERICVPALAFPTDDEVPVAPPRLKHLTLSKLRAMPIDAAGENDIDEEDCAPFFSSFDTSELRTLVIHAFDLDGRIWDDFIGALHLFEPTFPRVTKLELSEMDFIDMADDDVPFFLYAFPALKRLVLDDWSEGMWKDIIEVLELNPELCPELRELEVEDGVILRDDPCPFREDTFYGTLNLAYKICFC